jgi:hypothetical protein
MGAEISQAVKSDLNGSTLEDPVVVGTSAQENNPQEAAAAGTCGAISNATSSVTIALPNTSSSTAIALSTTAFPTTSDIALPTISASSDERALSSAVSTDDVRIRSLGEIKKEDVALPLEIVNLFEIWKARSEAASAIAVLYERCCSLFRQQTILSRLVPEILVLSQIICSSVDEC